MEVLATDLVSRRRRRVELVIVLGTVLLGLVGAVAVSVGAPTAGRTFAAVSGAAQSLISVGVPLLGVLLVGELRRPIRLNALLPTAGRALGMAMLLAVVGVLICAAVTTLSPSDGRDGPWRNTGMVVLASLLVQVVAQLVGLGMGLLIRRRLLACLATIVLPLGLWGLLGAVAALRPAQSWLTPFPAAQHLLSGLMTPTAWAQWLIVLVVWGVGLPALALVVDQRRRGGRVPSQR